MQTKSAISFILIATSAFTGCAENPPPADPTSAQVRILERQASEFRAESERLAGQLAQAEQRAGASNTALGVVERQLADANVKLRQWAEFSMEMLRRPPQSNCRGSSPVVLQPVLPYPYPLPVTPPVVPSAPPVPAGVPVIPSSVKR